MERPTPAVEDGDECRQTSLEETPEDPVELMLTILEASRENDRRCGTPDATERICRALVAISTIDPAHYLDRAELRVRSADLITWVSLDAAAASGDPDLRTAFELIGQTAGRIGDRAPDRELAELIMARGSASVLEALQRAWHECP